MAPTGSRWKLAIEDDEGQTTSLDLAQNEYAIGRGEDNDIRLTERNVSRRHATVRNTTEGWEIVDERSYNGTFVNGERISGEGVLLSSGDIVNIGDYRLELQDVSDQLVAVPDDATRTRRPDRLVVVIGPAPGVEFSLDGDRLSMGRAEEADVSINHASVSRLHAELVNLGQARWEVIDQGSSNGIRINGVELRRGIIEPGDALELGDVRLRYVAAGKYFRPAVDLSQALPTMPFEGMTTGQAPSSGGSRNVGAIFAVLAIVVVVIGGGAYAMFGAPAGAGATDEVEPMAETDEQARQYLDRAIALADTGDIQAAHDILQKIPESSSVREAPEYGQLEDRWADAMFEKAEAASALDEKLRLYTLVADATTVSMEKRRIAADKVYELTPEEDRKKNPRPLLQNPPTPGPAGTWTPPPVAPKPPSPQPSADKPAPKVPEKFDENAQKKSLMNKAMSGRASETELRMLKAICMNDGDRACRDMAVAKLAELKKQQQND